MTTAPEKDTSIGFIVFLRALACLLVVYCHMIGFRAPPDWFLKPYLDRFVTEPLAIMWQFGYLGVAIFYIISGFIITHVAQRETRTEFVTRRIFRVYPPFVVACLLALALAHAFDRPAALLSPTAFLRELSLFGSRFTLVGPSYTLTIELFFYAVAMMVLPHVTSRPVLSTAFIAVLPGVIHSMTWGAVSATDHPTLDRLLRYQAFVSIFPFGMAIYHAWTRRISIAVAGSLIFLAWCVFVYTTGTSPNSRSFQLNTLYALIVFLALLWLNPRFSKNGVVAAVAAVSYSLYLLHDPIGSIIMDRLVPGLGFTWAILICLSVVGVASIVSYLMIEKPSQRAGKWLLARLIPLSRH